jgi:hypothetical protein
MPLYTVGFVKDGYIVVEASNPDRALELAEQELNNRNDVDTESKWQMTDIIDEN